ncbi:MAG: hypothetical protein KDA91_00375 [Planctomycetaceae bacterium]|nr:hypothetical protein [Planctomycetaceae bacterium]
MQPNPLSPASTNHHFVRSSCKPKGFSSVLLGFLLLVAILTPLTSADEEKSATEAVSQDVIVVIGADGAAEYGEQFRRWADRWKQAATAGDASLIAIGEVDTDRVATEEEPSDADKLKNTIISLGQKQTPEPLWIVLIGHGTFDSRTAMFNLRGADVSDRQMSEWLQTTQRPVAVINCFSSSSPFLNTLSGNDRVVISATKDASQIQFSHFGDAMSQAIVGLEADIDRDGQTSLLEAWLFASRQTASFYESVGRLATEHSLLDDNGDARGVRSELFEGLRPNGDVEQPDLTDGRLAARWHLVRSEEEKRLTADEREKRDSLESQLEILRGKKKELSEESYFEQLEQLMIPLAELYESVEERHSAGEDFGNGQ